MSNYICIACGVQYQETAGRPPEHCLICEDDRQYIRQTGQAWTDLPEMRRTHHNRIEDIDPNITGIGTVPAFGLGPRALLVQTSQSNVLWDCVSLLDDATMEAILSRGGINAIAVSHPHLAGSLVEWSHAFGNAPIYWHADNRDFVTRPDPAYQFWDGETLPLQDGLTLVRCGGHFPGSDVLHWAQGAEGRGALLTGDTIHLAQDRRYVSFMYSYPNMIPLNTRTVEHIVQAIEPLAFDRLYGSYWDYQIPADAKSVVKRSAERYIKAISP